MDAQNANEAAPPKPSASSASSRLPDADRQRTSSSSSAVAKPSALSRAALPSSKDAKSSSLSASKSHSASSSSSSSAAASSEASKDSAAKSSAASSTRDSKDDKPHSSTLSAREKQQEDDGGTDGSSEAETIVLSKDGSPAKPRNRKVIKHEDKPNGVSVSAVPADSVHPSRRHLAERKDDQSDRGNMSAMDFADGAPKKKRLHDKLDKLQPNSNRTQSRAKDVSSSLSSAPGSPPHNRNATTHPQSGSDTDHIHRAKSPKRSHSTAPKDRLRPPEKLVPYKRKASRDESDDDVEFHKARRQRLANATTSSNSEARPSKDSSRPSHGITGNRHGSSTSHTKSQGPRASRDASQNRSVSPQPRLHRRSLSTHAASHSNGVGQKKKCVPAPLHSTDYHSDDSSASGSSRVRSAKLRHLATPMTAESSPAKTVPHKKHLDAHGQTYLARACARGEYELAKQRLQERPEDLNVADFAGNTPLQIAALNGYGNIVKLLIDAGCNLDCVNHDKDTPLLDAVDNGHLEVVKLLLDAGVNPRKPNVNGEKPLDRVDDSVDNADAIRMALIEAKKKIGERRFTSEENRHENDDLKFLQDLESPRRSPAPGGSSSSRRVGTIRATKTSNHLLYMPMDDKTLRLAAGRGDEQYVTRILQVREDIDDPEAMVAASRGGHDVVLQLLLALGRANPDPAPITNWPPEHATPMLAAIGQENLKVVSLLLEQSNFDPTKRFNGDTYYEIARKRAGPNWKEEEDILKTAYDNYKKNHPNKTKSPPRKSTESRRTARPAEPSDETAAPRVLKRKPSSPSLERPKKTGSSIKAAAGSGADFREEKGSGAHKRSERSEQSASHTDRHPSPKRTSSSTLSARPNPRDDHSSVTSNLDRDTPPLSKQVSKSRKTDTDSVAMSSEGETAKPRKKKLVSGRELKDEKVREKEKEKEKEKERERERGKQRRPSLASTSTATPSKDSASPREARHDDPATDKARADKRRERDRDRARQLKKEDSKESSGAAAGEGTGKRHRSSETPPNAVSSDKDGTEAPVKKRRLDADNAGHKDKEKKQPKSHAASNDQSAKSPPSISVSAKATSRRREGSVDDRKVSTPASLVLKSKKREASSDRARKDSSKHSAVAVEKSIHVKSEDVDVEMSDLNNARPSNGSSSETDAKVQREKDEEKKKKADAESKRKDEELLRRRKEDEDKKRKEAEEKRKKEEERHKREQEEAERLRKEEEKKREAEEKKEAEEKRKKKEKEEEEEKERLKRKREEEEERQRKEERKRKEEEEKRRREEEEEERKRKLEEEKRKMREEEERLRKEELAREAAAKEAQLKRKEEERQERLRREQEQRELERVRAEKDAEERRAQLEEREREREQERRRIASLPPLLRWLSAHANPQTAELATLFKVMQGVRYDCINQDANGTAEGREQWLVNTQVALLFGDKDLELSRYPSWRRLPASRVAKQILWNLESDVYSLTDPLLFDLGKQLPDLYGRQGPRALGSVGLAKIRDEASDKFFATDMFFVKASDVMATIPSLPHLREVKVAMQYRELPEHESQLLALVQNPKWKCDPDADRNLGFAPGTKYFVNGAQVGENRPGLAKDIRTPPQAVRVPRRGFVSVPYNDPEFETICKQQNIDPFSFPAYNKYKARLQNGVPLVNGQTPTTNGSGAPLPNGHATWPSTANGVNGTSGS